MNSNDVRERWAERSGEYSPDYYAYYGPDEASDAVRARIEEVVGPDAAVLELGCSSGRHLAHLREAGFRDLHGIDINDESFEVMAEAYPDLADEGTFRADAIENAVTDFGDDRFDAVFSVETLQHIHPDDAWVFEEVCRITGDLLLTVEVEDGEASGPAGDGPEGGDDEGDGPEGGDAPAGGDGAVEDDASAGSDVAAPDVNYVDEEVPLYYRDWNRVFTELGLAEVDTESLDRDTLRAFRPA
ncbi:class I SAM-dependent methyltransferase [Halorussus salilacus]|uniref:class I SAM-dependent methyltransferase n=1 Tax=Halorussus salilacus TaxID=2953750 RepID=UPI00209C6F2E|nr:class I SAM-dependent methyltransferase [Halorussus salilacus]USZ68257.1 class I SAM-dependent methyltransferase [Halorussus salilacus]